MERFCVGLDVSSETLEVGYRDRGRAAAFQTFGNEASAHGALVRHLKKRAKGAIVRIVLESSGVYSLDIALALDHAGFEVMVVNPRASANFAKAVMQRSKTDRQDALMLLEFAEQMKFVRWQPPTPAHLELRMISRRVFALMGTVRDEKNRLHAASHIAGSNVVKRSIRASLKNLERQVAELRAAAVEIIRSDANLSRRFDLLLTVKGIGEISAISILAELAVLPEDMTDRQWVAHAGLDPRQVESGTSLKLPPRISKRGNKYLRAVLYLPAQVASRFDPAVGAFAAGLRERGKAPLVIHVAVMRKLLHAIHAMFRTDCPFDGRRFCPAAAGAAGTSGIASSAISEVSAALSC